MAATYATLADLLRIADKNATDLGISDLLDDAPLLRVVAADKASNATLHKYTKVTSAAEAGFRNENVGRDATTSTSETVTATLKILDNSFPVDKALADAYPRGGAEAYIARYANHHLRGLLHKFEKQFLNGTAEAAAGFDGLADLVDASMVIDAEGGDDTGDELTSIYLIRTNDSGMDCMAIIGQDGEVEIGESVVIQAVDTDGKQFPAYYTPLECWSGCQLGSKFSVARICNIDGGDHPVTDDLIYSALALFPASRQPNYIAMNRRSLEQLRNSRTATNATGAPAPRPTEVEGIAIVPTDALTNDETEV